MYHQNLFLYIEPIIIFVVLSLSLNTGKEIQLILNYNIYLGNLTCFSSCVNHTAKDSSTRLPDWWAAAIGTGTYVKRVVTPSATWNQAMVATALAAVLARGGSALRRDNSHSPDINVSVAVPWKLYCIIFLMIII